MQLDEYYDDPRPVLTDEEEQEYAEWSGRQKPRHHELIRLADLDPFVGERVA